MMRSAARREYSVGNEPQGFVDYWDDFHAQLYVVACLMYLEKVLGTDSHWLEDDTCQNQYPNVYRYMESLRCVRNSIVHHGASLSSMNTTQSSIISDYDSDVRAGSLNTESTKIEPVRRQGFWNQLRPKLKESLAHLVGLIMRRAGGDASGALRVSFV